MDFYTVIVAYTDDRPSDRTKIIAGSMHEAKQIAERIRERRANVSSVEVYKN